MAKQTNSYLGGFSGRLGPAVGYRWKGVWCVRSLPGEVYNPRTTKQMEHREMFREEVRTASHMADAINLGLRSLADEANMTTHNTFVCINQHAFSLVDKVFTVDYASLRLSAGPTAPVAFGTPSVDEGNRLTVSFEKNPQGLTSASPYDYVYLYAYCPAQGQGFLSAPVHRRDKRLAVLLPSHFDHCEVHLYGMVCNREGMMSETLYIGHIILQQTASDDITTPEQPISTTAASMDSTSISDADQPLPDTLDAAPASVPARADPSQLSLW